MNLTTEKENDLMVQYEPFISKTVSKFQLRKAGSLNQEMEDLLQEARIEFLLHMRRIESMNEILACTTKIEEALRRCLLSRMCLSIPPSTAKKYLRLKRISYEMLNSVEDVSFDQMKRIATDGGLEYVLDNVFVSEFVKKLDGFERKILILRLCGYDFTDILYRSKNITESKLKRILFSIQQSYFEYAFGALETEEKSENESIGTEDAKTPWCDDEEDDDAVFQTRNFTLIEGGASDPSPIPHSHSYGPKYHRAYARYLHSRSSKRGRIRMNRRKTKEKGGKVYYG